MMFTLLRECFLSKKRSKLKERSKNCPICSCENIKILGKNPDFDKCDVGICSKCGFMFTVNCDNVNFYQYYKAEYRETRHETVTSEYLLRQNLRAEAQKDFILKYEKDIINKKVLEMGCGCGSFLKILENYSCDLTGFEPDEAMFSFAKQRLPKAVLYNDLFKCNEFKSETFDIILLSHVLEHVENLSEILLEIKRLLKPNGVLFIEVPSESVKKVLYNINNKKGLGHLWFFNKNNITVLLKKYFHDVYVKSFGISINELLNKRKRNFMYKLLTKVRIYKKSNSYDFRLENNNGIYLRICCRKGINND